MNSNVISTLQRNINIEWGGRGEPTDIAQKIAYRSTIFGQDCSYKSRNYDAELQNLFIFLRVKFKVFNLFQNMALSNSNIYIYNIPSKPFIILNRPVIDLFLFPTD